MSLYNLQYNAITGDYIGFGVTDETAKSYMRREMGLNYASHRNKAIANAISAPQTYIENRQKALEKAGDKAGLAFKQAFEDYVDAGFTEEDAKYNAYQHGKAIYRVEEDRVNLTMPESFANAMMKARTEGNLGTADLLGPGGVKPSKMKTRNHKKARSKQ